MFNTSLLAALWLGVGACGGDSVEPAPDLSFELLDGSEVSLAGYEGRPLVVNFFAHWCAPCVTEMPALEEVHQDMGDDVAFLGLSVQETQEEAQALVDETGVTYDIARDPRGEAVTALGGVGMPTTVLIDAEGNIAESHTSELSAGEITEMIRSELLD
ncbi:hypothetical protein BH18ACT4_BH18ACT4_10930 [soil metagenome]